MRRSVKSRKRKQSERGGTEDGGQFQKIRRHVTCRNRHQRDGRGRNLQSSAEHGAVSGGDGGDPRVGDYGNRDVFHRQHVPDPFGCAARCDDRNLCVCTARIRTFCRIPDGVGVLALQHLRQCRIRGSADGCAGLFLSRDVQGREQYSVHYRRIDRDLADEFSGSARNQTGGVHQYGRDDFQTGAAAAVYCDYDCVVPLFGVHGRHVGRGADRIGGDPSAGIGAFPDQVDRSMLCCRFFRSAS